MRISDWSSDVCSSDLGYSGVPFRIAANGALTPDLWRIALNGRVNGVDVKTQSPARIIPGADGYRLQPTVITFGKGAATVAGAFGKAVRSEEHTSELQSLMRISYAVFCLKKKQKKEED